MPQPTPAHAAQPNFSPPRSSQEPQQPAQQLPTFNAPVQQVVEQMPVRPFEEVWAELLPDKISGDL
eukprot:1213043-Amphidinium_carterae.6